MKRIIVTALVLVCFWMGNRLMSMSDGALNLTGAPGEGDCTGCHGGTANTVSGGRVTIKIAGNPTTYIPGQTYDVQVTASFAGRSRFGFGLAARKGGQTFLPIGSFSATGTAVRASSDFATHRVQSTVATNQQTWNLKWTAPPTNEGTITLYAAGVASNMDNSSEGDHVYTTSLSLSAATTGVPHLANELTTVYPAVVSEKFNIRYQLHQPEEVSVSLFDLNGKQYVVQPSEKQEAGQYDKTFALQKGLQQGVYIVQLKQGNADFTRRIFVSQQ